MAPSAHNTQPWRFTPLPDGRVAVGWKPERALPIGDPTSRDLYLSLGAAVESACLHGLTSGAPIRFEPAPPEYDDLDRTVGWLLPDPGATPDSAALALAGALTHRQTARGPHLPHAVSAAIRDALIAEAGRHGRQLRIVTNRPAIRRLATLAGQATAALFAEPAVHAELWQWLRLDPDDPAYHRDGLTADCLELDGLPRWLARQTMPPARMRWLSRIGAHRLLALDTEQVARKSAAICLLSTPTWDRPSLIATGRVLQRLWLLAATTGLTTHPLSALLDCAETAGPTSAVFGGPGAPNPQPLPPRTEEGAGVGAFPTAVFRLGYAPPAARAPRLPLIELWSDPLKGED
jgi:hypothetical protein